MDAKTRRLALSALSPNEFEWLVHALIQAEEGGGELVRKMCAPDDGADTLVLRQDQSVRIAVQAKRFGSRIHWSQCEASLDKAIRGWEPEEVRFVFACDFTKGDQSSFNKLVEKARGIRISTWTLSDLERLLDTHVSIGPRFLGPDARSITAMVERASRLGGLSLSNTSDLLARAGELAKFGDDIDPHFHYGVVANSIEVPSPSWDELPYMTIEATDGKKRVILAIWPRSGHDHSERTFRFADDAEGLRVKEEVRQALAAGKAIGIHSGIIVDRTREPRVVKELAGTINWKIIFESRRTVQFGIQCESPHGTLDLRLNLRLIPPHEKFLCTFASSEDGLWFEVGLLEDKTASARLWLYLGTNFGPNAASNLRIASLYLKWITRTSVRTDRLIHINQRFDLPVSSPREITECLEKIRLFEMTVDLEMAFQHTLRFPSRPKMSEVAQLRNAHQILTKKSGTLKKAPELLTVSPQEIPQLAEKWSHPRSVDFRVQMELFGEILDFGPARYTVPPLQILSIRPTGPGAEAPAELLVGAIGSGELEWSLIEPLRLSVRDKGSEIHSDR